MHFAEKRVLFSLISFSRIFIPAGTWHFTVKISHCEFCVNSVTLFNNSSDTIPYCIQSLALRARALPTYNPRNGVGNLTTDSEFTFTETEPFTDGYYYLLVVSESQVSFNLAVTTTGKKILCKDIFVTICSCTQTCCKLTPSPVGHWKVLSIYRHTHTHKHTQY